MKNLKRILLSMALVAVLMFVVACDKKPQKTDNAPVIHGAQDKTIEKGTRFIPLEGITATDEEDGVLTESIVYTGNVNVNRVGTYEVTYTVYDSDGNEAKVTITITVVLTDNDAPMLTGVADKHIVVGQTFDPNAEVAATDAIDGNVDFTVEGTVDIWTVGEYVLVYKAKDAAGNEAQSERVITVSLGNFQFGENVLPAEVAYENGELTATISSGPIDTELADFGLVELKFTASNASVADLSFTLTNAVSQNRVSLTATETVYTVYFRLNQEITDGTLKLTGPLSAVVKNVSLKFGSAVDTEAPVISVPQDYAVSLPGIVTDPAVLKPFIIKGITALDNVDGNVTSRLDVDFGSLVLGELNTLEEITVFVVDNAGNHAEAKVHVQFLNTYETDIIKDPGFDTGSAEADGWILNGGAGEKRLEFVDGVMIHEVKGSSPAGWDSASSPSLRFDKGIFRAGNWYMLKFDAKATVARNMSIRIGLDTTEALGWIENFKGAHNYPLDLTTEMKTYHVIFYVHSDVSQGGLETVKVELKLGTFYWDNNKELNNPVTFDNFQFYLMSNTDNAPELTINTMLPTKFGKGATVNFTEYVTAYDVEDAQHITITSEMVDISNVNMNAAGVYTVVYRVSDSKGNEATISLKIKVLEVADNESPVIALAPGAVLTVDQFSEPIVLRDCVTITDNVDTLEELIISIDGSVDVNKAGDYEVTYIARDLSGNIAEHLVTFTVLDKEAPKFASDVVVEGVLKTKLGYELDLTKVFRATDNVDGPMDLTLAHITGYDAFMSGNQVVTLGQFEVTYKISDSVGNEATVVITVIVEEPFELIEGNVLANGLGDPGFTNGNSSALTMTNEADGSLKLEVIDIGGWTSFAHLKLNVTGASAFDNYYLVRMRLKANKAREVQVRVGKALEQDPWYNFYEIVEGTEIFTITEEYQTYELMYKANQENVTTAYLELRLGSGLANAANGDIIHIESFEVIELIKEQLVEGNIALDVVNEKLFVNGDSGASAVTYADGLATINITTIGGWPSAAHSKVNLSSLEFGKTYKVLVELKGSSQRKVLINMGCQLSSDPWYDYFTSKGALEFTIGTEFGIHEIQFTVDRDTTPNKYLEFRYGGGLEGAANGDVITIKQFKIIEMISSTTEPETEAKVNFLPTVNGSFTVQSVDYEGSGMANPQEVLDGGMVTIGHYIAVFATPEAGYLLKAIKVNGVVIEPMMGFYAYKVINGNDVNVSVEFISETANPNLIDITGNTKDGYAQYTFSADFMTVNVAAAEGKWGRFDFARITRQANIARVVISGGDGLKVELKLDSNNPNNTYDGIAGNKQIKNLSTGETTFEWDLTALGMDANILEKLVFWVYDNGASSGEFSLVSFVIYEAEMPTEAPVHFVAPENGSYEVASIDYDGGATTPSPVSNGGMVPVGHYIIISPTPATGYKLLSVKVNNVVVEKTGEYYAYKVLNHAALNVSVLFESEAPVPPYEALIHTNNTGNAIYSWSSDKKTVSCSAVPASMSQWANALFDAPTVSYNTVRVTLTGTEGLSIGVKVDTQTPTSNLYDSITGNKQYKEFTTEPLVLEWNLTALGMDALKIQKIVLWFYDASGTVTTASVTIDKIEFVNQ